MEKILSSRSLTKELFISVKPYAFLLTKNETDRDDLLQMSFLKVIEKKDQFSGGSAKSWIYRIMYTTFLDEFIDKKREELPGDDLPEIPMEGDQLNAIEESQAYSKFDECIEKLNEKERNVIRLRLSDLKVSQIAEIINESRVNVSQMSARSRIKLKDCMGVRL